MCHYLIYYIRVLSYTLPKLLLKIIVSKIRHEYLFISFSIELPAVTYNLYYTIFLVKLIFFSHLLSIGNVYN